MEKEKKTSQERPDSTDKKQSEDLFALYSRSFKDLYDQQLKLMSDYTNLVNPYFKQILNLTFLPFSFFQSKESLFKDVNTENTSLTQIPDLHVLAADQFDRLEKEWSKLTHEYQNLVKTRLELMNSAVEQTVDAYNRHLELSRENTKRVSEELNRQFSEVSKQYNAFWLEFFALMGGEHTFAVKPAAKDMSEKKQSKEVVSN